MLYTRPRKTLSQLKLLFKEQHILMMLLKEFRDGILICDSDGLILQVNQSLKNQLKLEADVTGCKASEIIRDEHFLRILETVMQSGESSVEEIRVLGPGHRELFFELHVVPILIPIAPSPYESQASPQPDGCVIIFHDMTDIRQTEKMRRDFVANVSHELRTPLSAIEGYSETLLDGALEDQAVCRDFVNVIHRHSLRLTQLVDHLLDLSKLESPDYKPEFAPVSLQTLIQQVLALVHDKAIEKGIHVLVDFKEPLPRVQADFSSLQQVMTNLLDNAIKYTPQSGRVEVVAFVNDKGKVQVDVSDNGLGIESKYLTRIFERFYRVDKARSREMGGTGLGLSIVKHIVQLHGGEIWVDSQVNQGSTFSFTLDPV
jgi:two-component system phosphate regulon sensor histidine kinase PhoR